MSFYHVTVEFVNASSILLIVRQNTEKADLGRWSGLSKGNGLPSEAESTLSFAGVQ